MSTKSLAIVSSLTFLVIFGIILITNGLLQETVRELSRNALSDADDTDQEAATLIFANLARDRDKLQRESEGLIGYQTELEIEEKNLVAREQKILAMLADLETAQLGYNRGRDAQAAKLSKVYEAMKPASAAPILATLDLDIVLQILANMKDRQAAKILANMNPGLAAEISTRLSARGSG
ncbi:hypothetical protein KKG45_07320 [bacterium]|nr:hypothetical protein [bacterium]MBU1073041.1 hypothetical protein [bacterium]MBU1674559.1 hypothetical protein [bacterium]